MLPGEPVVSSHFRYKRVASEGIDGAGTESVEDDAGSNVVAGSRLAGALKSIYL